MNETEKPARILIVDDDPVDREVYKRYLLNTPGRSFVFAEEPTGNAAISRIADFSPDCILLDFNLPDMNGIEMLELLRNGPARLPAAVVMLTAVKDERVAVAAMKGGAMDYLPKGQFATETIAWAVDKAIEKFRMQRELEEQQQRYSSLIEAMPQVVWTASPDGRIDYANSRWFECLGVDLAKFNESGWTILLHPEDRERFLEEWMKGLASENAFQIEHRLRRYPGENFRWFLSRAVPVRNTGGAITRWFGASTDIEDQKRSEIAVFARQKLESLGLLAGGIAHDFNNLLVGILGNASLVADALPPSHPQQPILEGIMTAGERAAHLTRQMLAYAGKGRFLIEPLNINQLVQSTCDLIKASIPRNVAVSLQLRQDLPTVDADSSQVEQVIMNLVTNAAEAVDDNAHGWVAVRTDVVEFARAQATRNLVTGALNAGRYVVIEVRDNGSGMTDGVKAKIFDPFFTTKFTGRGLGLSAVEGILRGHRGAMELRTAPGLGSVFRVYFPANDDTGAQPEEHAAATRRGAGTVLVVDDEEMVRRTAKLSLENGGFDVRLAESGPAAIRLLQRSDQNPVSLVLLDLSMPGMSGREVMEQIRTLGIEVPVVICSGYSEAEVFQQFSGLDIAGFVQKPFTARQLANRVSSILYPEQNQHV